jgi:hypothetical protein
MGARAATIAALALLAVGCMPPYAAKPGVMKDGTLYQGSTGPLSYQASTLIDARAPLREVTSQACQYAIVLPLPVGGVTVPDSGATGLDVLQLGVGWGDGGYARAMAQAEQDAAGGVLVDVRADRHFSTVLWIYRRDCVEIHASVAPPLAVPTP